MPTTPRRRFLRYLAASPALCTTGIATSLAGSGWEDGQDDFLIDAPEDALDVFDFHTRAKKMLPPAHYGYLATGTDGNETLHANRTAFGEFYLRPRRMVDTLRIETSGELLGTTLDSPILLAPIGSHNAFHADGELAVARATRSRGSLMMLSNVATRSLEDVIAARGAPAWQQLYPVGEWSVTEKILRRAERAGAPVVVLTVDLNGDSNRVMLGRYVRRDERNCDACHSDDRGSYFDRRPMYHGTGATLDGRAVVAGMTWDFVARLKESTSMKVVVKGIVTADDADACVRYGADAVYVSNHGGRAEASGRGAIASLPEVVAAVNGRVPVIFDSGVRRGTDVFKALALGADAVSIGRPYIWGLAAFGQAGVEAVIDMLNAEFRMVMSQMGAPTLADIRREHVGA